MLRKISEYKKMKEYLNEGLVLHTKIFYTLQRGKRIYTETLPEPEKQNDS